MQGSLAGFVFMALPLTIVSTKPAAARIQCHGDFQSGKYGPPGDGQLLTDKAAVLGAGLGLIQA
jgi:hypothetical protein